MEQIYNAGAGGNIGMHVDQNEQAHVYAVTEAESLRATEKGNSYNINTGLIGLTSATESAVLYFKNDEAPVNGESNIVIDGVIIGIDDEGTTTGMSTATILRNPTAGTIVSGASAVDANANRNFGSSNTLSSTSLAYKGAEGNTFTDGTDFGILLQQPGTRVHYPLDIDLPKGSSIGIKLDTDTSGGTTNIYVALLLHRKDGKNK
jgi:hypothetical protein